MPIQLQEGPSQRRPEASAPSYNYVAFNLDMLDNRAVGPRCLPTKNC